MTNSKALNIITFALIILFVYAATSKLIDYDTFIIQIGKSPLITKYASVIAWAIPTIEILISICLLIEKIQIQALYASFFIMLMFSFYIAFILLFSPYVPCSCGGILNNMGWTEHLIFNISFTLIAFYGIILRSRMEKQTHNKKYQQSIV